MRTVKKAMDYIMENEQDEMNDALYARCEYLTAVYDESLQLGCTMEEVDGDIDIIIDYVNVWL